MDNIIIKKIWADSVEDFFEIAVTATNDRITMTAQVYAHTRKFIDIKKRAKKILDKPFSYEYTCTDNLELNFRVDKRGVVIIKVCMTSDAEYNDTAKFTVLTDVASLDRFASKLVLLGKGELGTKILLHE